VRPSSRAEAIAVVANQLLADLARGVAIDARALRSAMIAAFGASDAVTLGFVASAAAAITAGDIVLEPSAGTGLLAIHAELAGARLFLNEIADTRADLLDRLFPGAGVTRYDAAHIDDHLEVTVRPSVVLMNPPFSAALHVDGRIADAVLRHMSSALVRLADGVACPRAGRTRSDRATVRHRQGG
jgi:predicted RNA methylase